MDREAGWREGGHAAARAVSLAGGIPAIARHYADLPGWTEDDPVAAFRAFASGARHMIEVRPRLRTARPPSEALVAIGGRALAGGRRTEAQARAFFEREFQLWEIAPLAAQPFFTGYFEPRIDGALAPSADFKTPVLGRPSDLVTLAPGEPMDGGGVELTSAMRHGGGLAPCPDRAAIEAGALAGRGLELLWLRDRVALFIVQVQGSARVRLPDGKIVRLRYAGRNGWPYTSIGRLLIDSGAIAAEEMSLEALMAWLRAHPDEAEAVMRRNRSYVFFAIDESLATDEGPIGGSGVPLTAGRSIAVDRSLWSYGLPFFIDVARPEPEGRLGRWRRLMVAQDTGTAIVGAGRVDIFVGAGEAAGTLAGRQRHHGRLFVLLPREASPTSP